MSASLGRFASIRLQGPPPQNQRGVSLIELSVVAAVLVTIIIAATDYSLSILARQEVQSTARAGAEFASERGYNPIGIQEAALCSKGTQIETQSTTTCVKSKCTTTTTSSKVCIAPRFHTGTVIKVNQSPASALPRPICACNGDFYAGIPADITSTGAYTCKTLPQCLGGTVPVSRSAYVEVTASGNYSPLFPFLGWGKQSSVPITAKSVIKTFFP